MSDWPLFQRDFHVLAYLRPEVLTPEIIGQRTCALVDRLAAVHPLLTDWVWGEWEGDDGDVVETPFAIIRQDLATAINRRKKIIPGTGGQWIEGLDGYSFDLLNRSPDRSPQMFGIGLGAGGSDSLNRVTLETSDWGPADPSLLTFDVMRAATLALCESFQAMFCNVFQGSIKTLPDLPGRCMLGAMNYLGSAGAALVTPPPGVFAERHPDGGLLMVATRDRFDPENPAHVAATCAIHEALAPYNALPDPI
jgi:hypothetical protein